MTRFGYYSPLWIGFGVGLLLLRQLYPLTEGANVARYWSLIAAGAAAIALLSQLGMVGAQGAFGQVLPAPGGRSIRGRIAVVTGAFILAAIVLALVAGVLLNDKTEDLRLIARFIGGGAIATAIAALVAYFWGMPAAVADFGGKD